MNEPLSKPDVTLGLTDLARVPLSARHQAILDWVKTRCHGPTAWSCRKLVEARELLALAQVSGRLEIGWLDLADDLRVVADLLAPAPYRSDPTQPSG